MKAIYVLLRLDPFRNRSLVEVVRKRQLNEDPVDVLVCVQLIHDAEQLLLCDIRRRPNVARQDSRLLAGLRLHPYVHLRSGVLTDENDPETRLDSLSGELRGIHS